MFNQSAFGTMGIRAINPVLSGAWMGQDENAKKIPIGPRPTQRPMGPMGPQGAPRPENADQIERRETRICDMLKKFSEDQPGSPEEGDARSRIFWSYVRQQAEHTGQVEDAVAKTVQARCPDMALPPKPVKGPPMMPPGKTGFHGKTQLSYNEAKELSDLLTVVLSPLTPEEASKELAREACLRDIVQADGFPIVDKLQERLKTFLATAAPTDTFEISHGEVVVTGKAVECAEAMGRIKVIKTVAYTGGAVAGGASLLWLLGLL